MNIKLTIILYLLLLPSTFTVDAAPVNINEEASFSELLNMSLSDLMSVKISLASRTEEKQFEIPAAVYVLTSEDIKRSGHQRLPEILRMVPGLHVAKFDSNKWSVSSRNSQTRFSSTMLVMIDGRHVYSPFYAGVYWESLDLFIDDIDRIEVIRGPGGALWGANAVDGIINVITKSSADTQGSKVYGLVGVGEMKSDFGFRYGSKFGSGANYRIFAKGYKTDTGEYLGPNESTNSGLMPIGDDGNDDGVSQQVGIRVDWGSDRDRYMFQGDAHKGKFNEDRVVNAARVPNEVMSNANSGVLNWKRTISHSESLMINAFYNQVSRNDDILQNDETTIDIDLQHNMDYGTQNIAWGLGYRYYDNKADITDPSGCAIATPCFSVDPANKDLTTWSAFIQDQVTVSDNFAFIIGSKFENNEYTGFEYQPTLRGLWSPDKNTTHWAAATRSVRIPDRVSTDGLLDFGGFTVPIGNKDEESFINITYELGSRKSILDTWVLDGTIFYSDYRNTIQGSSTSDIDDVYGFEGYVKHQLSSQLRAEVGYTYHEGNTQQVVGGDIPLARLPKNSLHFRSNYDLRNNMDLDVLVYYVDESKSSSGATTISAYTRVDVRYGWRPIKQLDLSLLLTNMIDDVHAEGIEAFKINTGVERGAMLKLTYTIDK